MSRLSCGRVKVRETVFSTDILIGAFLNTPRHTIASLCVHRLRACSSMTDTRCSLLHTSSGSVPEMQRKAVAKSVEGSGMSVEGGERHRKAVNS